MEDSTCIQCFFFFDNFVIIICSNVAENMLEGSNLNKQFVNLSRSDTKKDGGIGMIVKVGQ